MIRFANIGAFCAFLKDDLPRRVQSGKSAGLNAAGQMFVAEMQAEIGTYQSGDAGFPDWQKLSQRTLDGWDAVGGRLKGKIERGLAAPGNDNPLRAEGALAGSFGATVEGDALAAGSTDIVAVWQNQGTEKRGVPFVRGQTTEPGIPAREFVGRAGFRKAAEAAEAIGEAVVEAMVTP